MVKVGEEKYAIALGSIAITILSDSSGSPGTSRSSLNLIRGITLPLRLITSLA